MDSSARGAIATDYSYTLQTSSYDSQAFSQPSFVNPPISGNLAGGAKQNTSTGQAIYSYSVPPPTATQGYAPNGNLLSYTDLVMGAWSFGYDSLNRLAGAPTSRPFEMWVRRMVI